MASLLWTKRRGPGWRIGGVAAVVAALAALVGGYSYHTSARHAAPTSQPPLSISAAPVRPPTEQATQRRAETFERMLVDEIQRDRRLLVVVHVALAGPSKRSQALRPAFDLRSDLRWGAMYGFATYLSRLPGWRRVQEFQLQVIADQADRAAPAAEGVVDSVLLRSTVRPDAAWQARGVKQPFDVFVLGIAYAPDATLTAMQACVQQAMGRRSTRLTLDREGPVLDRPPVVVGYLGRNAVAEEPVDLFAALRTDAPIPTGVFFAASHSALQLHAACVHHGLYPVLFAREPIVPEAYLIEGILSALDSGKLDDGFLDSAATAYARRQKGVSPQRARDMLFR
ncbi:MAG: hypothetical protein HBSAPP02_26450 [Phycisphaerae bacterium]|nr:MAG: hypothetical protein HRU71_14350 [Planctomycetia bacterium]GJQ27613.1 MAG: hypothetical protein HBSAPP02_26450 [Phycisphaerae bacterium]